MVDLFHLTDLKLSPFQGHRIVQGLTVSQSVTVIGINQTLNTQGSILILPPSPPAPPTPPAHSTSLALISDYRDNRLAVNIELLLRNFKPQGMQHRCQFVWRVSASLWAGVLTHKVKQMSRAAGLWHCG
jgi:hypothetical protein